MHISEGKFTQGMRNGPIESTWGGGGLIDASQSTPNILHPLHLALGVVEGGLSSVTFIYFFYISSLYGATQMLTDIDPTFRVWI